MFSKPSNVLEFDLFVRVGGNHQDRNQATVSFFYLPHGCLHKQESPLKKKFVRKETCRDVTGILPAVVTYSTG